MGLRPTRFLAGGSGPVLIGSGMPLFGLVQTEYEVRKLRREDVVGVRLNKLRCSIQHKRAKSVHISCTLIRKYGGLDHLQRMNRGKQGRYFADQSGHRAACSRNSSRHTPSRAALGSTGTTSNPRLTSRNHRLARVARIRIKRICNIHRLTSSDEFCERQRLRFLFRGLATVGNLPANSH